MSVSNMSIQLEEGLINTNAPVLFINGQYDAFLQIHDAAQATVLDMQFNLCLPKV